MGKFDATMLRDIVVVLVPMILSLTVHEFAHAWAAHKLGDDTAKAQGRLTLNPLPHIDLFGTILIPIISVISGGIGLIGWAKPVPVAPYRFRRTVTMRTGMILASLAGPASNLLLALVVSGAAMAMYGAAIDTLATDARVGSAFMGFMVLGTPENAKAAAEIGLLTETQGMVVFLLSRLFAMNLGLAIFNLLPVPPLDGSRLLPLAWQERLARYSLVVFFAFILLINFAGGVLAVPVEALGNAFMGFWSLVF